MKAPGSPDRLIVNADDFGLSIEVNEAVETAHRSGILTSASLMVSGPAAEDAIRRARALPGLRVGLHLVLVEGQPASPVREIPDLVDSRGQIRSDMTRLAFAIATRRSASRQIAVEIEAQFRAFATTGFCLDHVNAHKHFHLHPHIANHVFDIGRRHGMRAIRIPDEPSTVLAKIAGERPPPLRLIDPWIRVLRAKARRAGLAVPDWVFGLKWSGAMTANRLAGLLRNLPAGMVEIYFHPATEDVFPGHAPGYRYRDELSALCDPACMEALHRSGRPAGGYADCVDALNTRPLQTSTK